MIITTRPGLITNVQEVVSILKTYATTVQGPDTIAGSQFPHAFKEKEKLVRDSIIKYMFIQGKTNNYMDYFNTRTQSWIWQWRRARNYEHLL